jgi:DNA anti-recombination protein RmuC
MGLSLETRVFIGIICILAVFFHVRYDQRTSEQAPTILTTLGIFATFLAIAIGLLKFDSLNIQDSVPALLDSMKTAFWASVAGVGWALTFNFRRFFEKTEYIDDSNIDRELLKELKGLRNENSQNIKELAEAQNKALDKISKSSSDELVKALQEVIRDFNAKINEQFGENFKQLNEAVAKLLDWQEQYKVYIETSTESLSKITQDIQTVSGQFKNVVKDSTIMTENSTVFTDNAETFKDTANSLQSTLGNLDAQREAIQSQIENLSTLVSRASDDLPDISNKILGIANTMKNSATDFNNTVSELSNSTKNQTDTLTTGLEEALTQSLNSLGGQLSAMTEKFASDYNQLAEALSRISRATQNNGR